MTTLFRSSFIHRCEFINFFQFQKYYSSLATKKGLSGKKTPKWVSAEEAVSIVKSDDLVIVHPLLSTPQVLTDALATHAKQSGLKNVRFFGALTSGAQNVYSKEMNGIIRPLAFFLSGEMRENVNNGRGDFIPVFLCDTATLFRKNILNPRVALLNVSPADEHGFHSLGINVVCVPAALEKCDVVIGQVNNRVPRTFGDALIHESCFDSLVEASMELPEVKAAEITKEEMEIGRLIAENLVEDGSTIQVGIGSIPDAVLQQLENHKDLGIHTEMISDGCVDLMQKGIANNKMKASFPGLTTSTLTIGTRKLYDFMDNNPSIVMKVSEFTNDQFVIAKNPKVVAINSCIEIDLVGNVNSDSLGMNIYSGYGGQVDFLRGAAASLDGKGKAILTFLSTTSKGVSKIVPFLKPGSSVTTTRAHVHYVVTEYGIANLFGKNYRQRAHSLISIAHPMHREALEKAAFEQLKCMPSP